MIDIKYLYQTIRDIPVTVLMHCEKKLSTGIEAILPINSQLKISLDYNPGDQYIHCALMNGGDFEKRHISELNRNNPDYTGYSLSLKLSDVTAHCMPVITH